MANAHDGVCRYTRQGRGGSRQKAAGITCQISDTGCGTTASAAYAAPGFDTTASDV
jgi:hypothetical protein